MLKSTITALLLITLAITCASQAVAQVADTSIAVIVNANNPTVNVTMDELRKILLGEKHSWRNGARIKIIARGPGSRERLAMLKLMNMSESEYKQYWTAQIVRGEADAEPITIPSFGMTKEATKLFPGAISLVDSRDIKAATDVKMLKIDGHLPGEPDYPLR
jgi:ABC-type phosphate transport system substrate-binding protein